MHNIKVKALAAIMASLTAVTPIASAYTEVYASSDAMDTVTEISGMTETSETAQTESKEDIEESKAEETNFLFINLKTTGGKIVVDEGKEQEKTIRLEKKQDGDYFDVYDKDNVLISSEISKEDIYVYETKNNDVVNVKAVPDEGYKLTSYEISADDVVEDSGYDGSTDKFSSAVFMESDKTIKIGFEKEAEKDMTVDGKDEAEKDLTVNEDSKNSDNSTDSETGQDADLTVDGDSSAMEENQSGNDSDISVSDTVNTDDKENESSEEKDTGEEIANEKTDSGSDAAEPENDTNTETDTDADDSENSETDIDSVLTDSLENQENNSADVTADNFDISDFSSSRLIVMSDDKDVIQETDKGYLIGEYDNLYLLQYDSAEDALNAYIYYLSHASAVEPDKTVNAAEGEASDEEPEMAVDENNNPISALSEEADSDVANASKVVALIDTGANESANVVDRVSLIDDTLSGNGHGDEMANAIASQYVNAKILSIRALGDDGKGTASSIVAGIEYAINQNVDVINLSMYAKTNTMTSVLASEIKKAQKLGIEVVGAAGNDNADAKDYMPGSVSEAWIIGACDSEGVKMPTSNYGDTVDYNVVADSTSEAAAKFSGYILKHGIENLGENGLIFENHNFSDNTIETDESGLLYIATTLWTKVGSDFDPATNTDGLKDYIPEGADVVLAYSDVDTSKAGSYITIYHVTSGDKQYAVKRPVVVTDSDETEVGKYAVNFMSDTVGGVIIDSNATWYNAGDVVEFSVSSEKGVDIKSVNVYLMSEKGDSNAAFGDNIPMEYVETGELSEAEQAAYVKKNAAHYRFTMPDKDVYVNVMTQGDTFTVADDGNDLENFVVNQSSTIVSYYNKSVAGTSYPRQTRYRTVTYNWKNSNGTTVSTAVYCYCLQPSKSAPLKDGNTPYKSSSGSVKKISDSNTIAKALYYLYGGHRWNQTVTNSDGKAVNMKTLLDKYAPQKPGSTGGNGYYALTHLILGYLYSGDSNVWNKSDDGISGNVWNSTGVNWLKSLQAQLEKLPAPTVTFKECGSGKTVEDGTILTKNFSIYNSTKGTYRSVNYMYAAAVDNKAKVTLPTGVTLHYWYDTAGGTRVSKTGTGTITDIPGGSRFFLEVDPAATAKAKISNFEMTFFTTYSANFEAWRIVTGATTQDLGFGYRTGDFKVSVKVNIPAPAKLKIKKHVTNWPYLKANKRYGNLNTKFTVYSDSGCSKAVDTISITSSDSSGNATFILNPGTYYMKETMTIPGTATNTAKYGPIKLNSDDNKELGDFVASSKRASVSMDVNGTVLNYPFRYRGRLFKKVDANTKGPLQGAVFKVEYSVYGNDTNNNTKFETERTWYFVTDKNGEVKYESSYLADNNAKFKNKYKSSAMFTYDGKNNALPLCALRIQEVEAPAGYVLDSKVYSEWTVYKQDSKGNYITTDYNLAMRSNNMTNFTIENTPVLDRWKLQANVKKVDKNGKGLAGAVFGIYDNEADAKNEENPLVRLTTGSNGMSGTYQMTDIDRTITSKTLYCKELIAPEGYVKTDEVFPLTWQKSEFDKLYTSDTNTKGQLQTFGGTGIINTSPDWYVSFATRKIDKFGNGLTGATFGVYDNPNCNEYSQVGTLGSDIGGATNMVSLGVSGTKDEITLYCKELKAPDGYVKTNEVFSQTWYKSDYTEGDTIGETKFFGTADGIVNDEGWQANVFAKKIGVTKNPLQGAEFTVYRDEALTKEVGTITSGTDGVTDTLTVTMEPSEPSITLYCKETKAPAGCTPTDEVFRQTFTKEEYDANGDKKGLTKQFGPEEGIQNDDPWKVEFKLNKVDTEGNPLQDAEFTVYSDKECKDEDAVAVLLSGEDGWTDTEFVDVEAAQESITLYCKETAAPDGYQLSEEVFEQTWYKANYRSAITEDPTFEGEEKLFGTADGIVNKLIPEEWVLRYQIKKVSETGDPLKGAKFGVYTMKDCSDESLISELESGDGGMSDIFGMSVSEENSSITLYCKELEAPEGYALSNEVYELTYTQKDYKKEVENGNEEGELKLFGPNGVISNQKANPPTVRIHKTSTAESDLMDLEGYTLEGAEFTIESDSGFSATLTTDKDGNTNSVELPNESAAYIISETTPPAGHEACEPKDLNITMPDDGGKDITVEFEDEPAVVGNEFKIVKSSTKGNPIEGVVFKTEFFDGTDTDVDAVRTWYLVSDADGVVTMDDAHLSKSADFVSDAFYKHNNIIVIPVNGTLRVTEVQAPAQYVVDSTPKIFETSEDTTFTDELGDVVNDLAPAKIRIKKYDTDGTTPLKGVTFELKYLEETESTAESATGYTRLLKVGESTEATTDENGEIVWENLDQGKYRITETSTVAGHTLLAEPIEVTLPIAMTEEEVKANNADISKGVLDKGYTGNWLFYDCLYEITNSATFKIPMTGGNGTWTYAAVGFGALAAMGAGLVLLADSRKKQKRVRRKKNSRKVKK